MPDEIEALIKNLQKNPQLGESLGKNTYKIRLQVKSEGGGKSGGLRVITAVYINFTPSRVYMLFVFDKSEMENISNKDLIELLKQID